MDVKLGDVYRLESKSETRQFRTGRMKMKVVCLCNKKFFFFPLMTVGEILFEHFINNKKNFYSPIFSHSLI